MVSAATPHSEKMRHALIGMGSNLGNRSENLYSATQWLQSTGKARVVRHSSWMETAPVGGPPGQGPFLNGALVLETPLEPLGIMGLLLECENAHGRVRGEKNGPRTLDLDLLLWGGLAAQFPGLDLPHPRMAERRFVLAPAAEIAPDWVHPILGKTMFELLGILDGGSPSGPIPGRELLGHTAFVAGSTSGIGQAIAEELMLGGARVILHGRRSELLEVGISSLGPRHGGLVADLSEPGAGRDLVRKALDLAPDIDIWVHNAGADILTGKGRHATFDEKLESLAQVDLIACMDACRAIGKAFNRRKGGTILTVGWDQAATGMEGESGQLFGAIKGGVMAFTKALAVDLAPQVRVNGIAPGWIRTAWGEAAPEAWQQRVVAETLLRRWGTPRDIAKCARFLCGPESSWITGQILRVNGGAIR